MASAALKKFEDDGAPDADLPFVDWAVSDSLAIIQDRLIAILDNFPSRMLGRLLKVLTFPLGRPYRGASDEVTQQLAGLLMTSSESRDRLTRGMFIPDGEGVGLLDTLLARADDIEPAVRAAAKHAGSETLLWTDEEAITRAQHDGAVTEIEAAKLTDYRRQLLAAIAVEAFEAKAGGYTAMVGESA